jgi:hypothetical protein
MAKPTVHCKKLGEKIMAKTISEDHTPHSKKLCGKINREAQSGQIINHKTGVNTIEI